MRFVSIFVLLVVVSLAAVAQEGSLTASVDRNRLAMGEQLELTFTFNGSGGSNFRAPAFDDFVVLSGPNQSTNMQIVNGAVSQSTAFSYILQPRAEGKFVIAPASISSGGKVFRSAPVTIEVAKGGSGQSGQGGKQGESADISKQIGDNLFIRVSADRTRIYQGEQITVSYRLFWRVSIASNPNITKVPSLSGFWSEDLPSPKQTPITDTVINGKQYKTALLKNQTALFPQRSGTLTLDPMEIECGVQVKTRRRSNDPFSQFFNDPFFSNDPFFGGAQTVNFKTKSLPVAITVLPLPSAGVPRDFNGAVGDFVMDAWLDKHSTPSNEPVSLKIKITGRGNIKLLQAPVVNVPSDIEKYDPKISDISANQRNWIAGSRTFEYLLIPRHPGELRIAPVTFSYFDVQKKSYVSLKSPEFNLSVTKGSEASQTFASGVSKEDVKLLGEDIRFIRSSDTGLRRRGEVFAGSAGFFALVISPVIAFAGFVVYMRRREKLLGNVSLVRNRKARGIARRRLQQAKKFLAARQQEAFYTEISRALYGYLGDKLGIPPAELSIDSVKSMLELRSIPPDTVAELGATVEQCEFARFAPSSGSGTMDDVYGKAASLISTIEDRLR